MDKTILHSLLAAKGRDRHRPGVQFKSKGTWLTYGWPEVYEMTEQLAHGLVSLGVDKGDRVVILSNTCPEWFYSDLAIMGLHAITVPIYPSSTGADVGLIVRTCQPKVIIAENAHQLAKISEGAQEPRPRLVLFNGRSDNSAILPLFELLSLGREHRREHPNFFSSRLETSRPEDIATILFTSGTTGQPRGVVLSHRQILSEVRDLFSSAQLSADDKFLSFLPYAHIVGRCESLITLYLGGTLAFAESIERLRLNLKEAKPTVLVGVPRVFEKIFSSIQNQMALAPIQKQLFSWALAVGRRRSRNEQRGAFLSTPLFLESFAVDRLLFRQVREQLGGNLRFAICGGAPLSPDICEFFHALGLLILEGYGLSETTGGIAINTPFAYRFGTVGKPLGDAKIQLAEDGEILVRSEKVMLEYYQDPEATKEAFTEDGFFKTGDIGEFTAEGFLRITDRKKDLIKTVGGKYVAPQKLENLLKLETIISNALLHGDGRKYIVALLTLNQEVIVQYAQQHQISYQDNTALVELAPIRELVHAAVARVNSQLSSFETIKNFAILPGDFSVEAGELTPSLKVRRKFCEQKYRDRLARLYEASEP